MRPAGDSCAAEFPLLSQVLDVDQVLRGLPAGAAAAQNPVAKLLASLMPVPGGDSVERTGTAGPLSDEGEDSCDRDRNGAATVQALPVDDSPEGAFAEAAAESAAGGTEEGASCAVREPALEATAREELRAWLAEDVESIGKWELACKRERESWPKPRKHKGKRKRRG